MKAGESPPILSSNGSTVLTSFLNPAQDIASFEQFDSPFNIEMIELTFFTPYDRYILPNSNTTYWERRDYNPVPHQQGLMVREKLKFGEVQCGVVSVLGSTYPVSGYGIGPCIACQEWFWNGI